MAYKTHNNNAKVFDKIAKQQEAKGSYVKAELARKSASMLRARGENIRAGQYETAERLVNKATKLNEKATKFATKKRVHLGKSKVDSILKESSNKAFAKEKAFNDLVKEKKTRDALGSDGYAVYNSIRGTR